MKHSNLIAQQQEKQDFGYFLRRDQLEEIHRLLAQAKFASTKLDDALSDQDFSKALNNLGVMEDAVASADVIVRQVEFNQEIKPETEAAR